MGVVLLSRFLEWISAAPERLSIDPLGLIRVQHEAALFGSAFGFSNWAPF